MALAPGTRFGPYQISAQIGEGGMGEVYRATDTNLARQVAIKVLPQAVAADAERLGRFDREAKTLAALNHPHIAAIYGLQRNVGTTALVMELVEGPTLADRILQGAIPLDDSLRIARQIAEALEAAHEQGIVHRDLKPANIKLDRNGSVKVLDFGLAKTTSTAAAASALASASPTIITPAVTETGIILGTAAYMSPEQAKGLSVDQRCDVWAFACVLYEMLTGRRAFPGTGVTETLAAILERDVDWSRLPAATPAGVRTLLKRALAKDPHRRLHHIADARLELEEPQSTPEHVASKSHGVPWPWVAGASLVLVALVAGTWRLSSASSTVVTMPPVRLSFVPDPPLSTRAVGALAMSPDGQHIAYVGGPQDLIYIRDVDRYDIRALPGTEGADMPAFSPDGQWIAFQAQDKLKKVALAGGAPIALADSADGHGVGWESNDSILFGPGRATGVWRIAAAGGTPQQLTKVNAGENSQSEAEGLPDGQAVIYRANRSTAVQIYAQSLTTGQRHLIDRGSNPHYLRSGHVAYAQDGALIVAPFDPVRLEKTGRQIVVASDIRQSETGSAHFALSQTGSLAYVPFTGAGRSDTLVWIDSSGVEQATAMTGEAFRMPRLSPDLQRVVVGLGITNAPQGNGGDLWIYELASNRKSKLTFDGTSTFPLWEPGSGRRMILSSRQGGESFQVLMKTLDGTMPDTPFPSPRGTNYPLSWSPDGRFVALVSVDPDTFSDIWVLTLGTSPPVWRPFVQTKFRDGAPTFSHDSRLIAYAADQSGPSEIYVRPFPDGNEVPVSTNGGTEPLFARDAPTLFYRHGDEMIAVDITGPPITVGPPRVIFKRAYNRSDGVWPNYDVTPDGKRLLMVRGTAQDAPTRINVVLNWRQSTP